MHHTSVGQITSQTVYHHKDSSTSHTTQHKETSHHKDTHHNTKRHRTTKIPITTQGDIAPPRYPSQHKETSHHKDTHHIRHQTSQGHITNNIVPQAWSFGYATSPLPVCKFWCLEFIYVNSHLDRIHCRDTNAIPKH